MKLRITNNRKAPYGVEKAGGGYDFVQPGKTKIVDVANPGPLYRREGLEVEAADSEVVAPPASLTEKVAPAPARKPRAKGVRRRKAGTK